MECRERSAQYGDDVRLWIRHWACELVDGNSRRFVIYYCADDVRQADPQCGGNRGGAGAIGYIVAGWPREALLPPLSLGFVSLIGLVLMAPLSSLTAPYGARLAHQLSRRTLEITFAIFLLLVSLRFVVSLF